MKKIKLTRGVYSIVEDSDYERINKSKWFYTGKYAVRWKRLSKDKRKMWYMHWDIIGKSDKFDVDHIDRNKLNNQRKNLRFVIKNVNRLNCNKPRKNKYDGVYFLKDTYNRKKKWKARIQFNGKRKTVGYFLTEKEAGNAYQDALKELIKMVNSS